MNASIAKPQLLFECPAVPFADSTSRFKSYSSSLTPAFEKHHSQVSIDHVLPDPVPSDQPLFPPKRSNSLLPPPSPPPPHPYAYELSHVPYPPSLTSPSVVVPAPPLPFDETPFTFVSTEAGLRALVATL